MGPSLALEGGREGRRRGEEGRPGKESNGVEDGNVKCLVWIENSVWEVDNNEREREKKRERETDRQT